MNGSLTSTRTTPIGCLVLGTYGICKDGDTVRVMQYSMLDMHLMDHYHRTPDRSIGKCRGVVLFPGLEWADQLVVSAGIGCYRPIKELLRSWNISGFGMGRFNIPLSAVIGPSRSCRGVGIFPGLEWADSTFHYRLLSAHQGVVAELEYFRVWNWPIKHSERQPAANFEHWLQLY
jgi:hypothetical protein